MYRFNVQVYIAKDHESNLPVKNYVTGLSVWIWFFLS